MRERTGYIGDDETKGKATLNQQSRQISDILLTPFAETIRSKSYVIFSISNPLTAFPLTVLYYLSQRKSESARPTVSVLAKSPTEGPAGSTRADREVNLHKADIETVNIARLFATWPIEASKLSRKVFQDYVEGGSQIMHIGTHMSTRATPCFHPSRPDRPRSSLLWTSCLSGFGKGTLESEVLGFSHIVLSTGCQAYIGPLWKLCDFGSMLLMTIFYRHLKKRPHVAVAELVRQAQLDLLCLDCGAAEALLDEIVSKWSSSSEEDGSHCPAEFVLDVKFLLFTLKMIMGQLDWSSPFYWVPFTLVGYGGFRVLREPQALFLCPISSSPSSGRSDRVSGVETLAQQPADSADPTLLFHRSLGPFKTASSTARSREVDHRSRLSSAVGIPRGNPPHLSRAAEPSTSLCASVVPNLNVNLGKASAAALRRPPAVRLANPVNHVPRITPITLPPFESNESLPLGPQSPLLSVPERRRSRLTPSPSSLLVERSQGETDSGRTSIALPPRHRRSEQLSPTSMAAAFAGSAAREVENLRPPEAVHLASDGTRRDNQPRHAQSQTSLRSQSQIASIPSNTGQAPADVAEELAWGPAHPCYPHLNPHVPIGSREYLTTRVIRIRRDWMVKGDLAPTFSNLYPEILDPLLSEQEFRKVIATVNNGVVKAFDPFSLRNWFDGAIGLLTGWVWDDMNAPGIKGELQQVESWLEKWNREVGDKDGVHIWSLRRTAYMSLDIQIPDPKVGIVPSEGPSLPNTRPSTGVGN
ncbi:hypothetical protein N7532_006550 [Penicillium argentinense]|uniref:Ras modification protein ERF4 n=1 Tax=Penicillium argentinense TaxID=1131581 RepID=A0A9W9FG71_9EURO|nr:uncharacterized protein N7532_006550 [Penicillium argentinense]KAJ5099549.1 hypothetical protein N7532_006550 [Penicillium argentinense]